MCFLMLMRGVFKPYMFNLFSCGGYLQVRSQKSSRVRGLFGGQRADPQRSNILYFLSKSKTECYRPILTKINSIKTWDGN